VEKKKRSVKKIPLKKERKKPLGFPQRNQRRNLLPFLHFFVFSTIFSSTTTFANQYTFLFF